MTCKDCISFDVCSYNRYVEATITGEIGEKLVMIDHQIACKFFKDKNIFVPVKSGEWAHLGGDEWCCTNCGNVIFTEGSWEKPTQKFCDECGAKMKIEVVEEW